MRTRSVMLTLVAALAVALVAGCEEEAKRSPKAMEAAAASGSPMLGRPAPAFTLPDQNDQPVSLTDLRGRWVVLYFYPKDDTPGCTCQATEFTALLTHFRGMNAEVYGVSEDPPWSHQAFIKAYDLKLDLLSDPDHEVMRKYGAWVESQMGGKAWARTIRTTYIIDPKGVIRYHMPEVIPQGHAERVREKLAELQGQA